MRKKLKYNKMELEFENNKEKNNLTKNKLKMYSRISKQLYFGARQ